MFGVYVYCHMWCLLFGVLAHKGAEILGETSRSVISKGSTKFKAPPYRIEQFVFSRVNSQKSNIFIMNLVVWLIVVMFCSVIHL